MQGGESTHPDYASLVDPLYACGVKRVNFSFLFFTLFNA